MRGVCFYGVSRLLCPERPHLVSTFQTMISVFSDFLSRWIDCPYTVISALFSQRS